MARIRTIKPEFWEDEKLSALPLEANLLFIALWNFADDEGILKSSITWIKAKAFPLRDEIRKVQVEQWIGQLVKARFLVPFSFHGEGYYMIRTFKNHQVINRPQGSRIPQNIINELNECLNDDSLNTHGIFSDNSLPERKGKERKGKGKEDPQLKIYDPYVEVLKEKFLDFFPEDLQPKTESQIEDWADCLKKLIEIDHYTEMDIGEIVYWAREDSFWSSQFMSFLKLRKKNKDGVKYIDYFKHQMNSKNGNKRSNNQPATSDADMVDVFARKYAADYPGK